ncbi:hypothetical protein GCM10022207_93010 [Streptomyces lannensis]|uniref:Uncharacterized protein n=1 Tax=Streptomyces lannensis TaxID=766498 RepID=A0ABP7LUI0_9ACTN
MVAAVSSTQTCRRRLEIDWKLTFRQSATTHRTRADEQALPTPKGPLQVAQDRSSSAVGRAPPSRAMVRRAATAQTPRPRHAGAPGAEAAEAATVRKNPLCTHKGRYGKEPL